MGTSGARKRALNKRKNALSELKAELVEKNSGDRHLSRFLDSIIDDMTTEKKLDSNEKEVREASGGKGGSVSHYEHSFLVAKHLRDKGYENIEAEEIIPRRIDGEVREALHPDIIAHNGNGPVITEVELNRYRRKNGITREEQGLARFIGKISRYSAICNEMFLAFPKKDFNVLFYEEDFEIPLVSYFAKHPSERSEEEVNTIKEMIDEHYTQPKIEEDLLYDAHLDGIYLTNRRNLTVDEIDIDLFRGR